jgi:hypothetical protein
VTKVGNRPIAGLMKDTINMTRYSSVEIDFIADEPGPLVVPAHPTREAAPQPLKVSASHVLIATWPRRECPAQGRA